MDVFNIFNKASQKITDYFSIIEKKIQNPQKEIQDSLIQINPKIFVWIKDTNFKDEDFIHVIHSNFKDNYMIYNLLEDKIETNTSPDKIVDFKLPNNPSFTLEFLISFCISSKNWLNANDDNILVIHDDITKNDGNIFYLISTIIAYNNNNNNSKNKNQIKEPVDIYVNLLAAFENHKYFQKLPLNNNSKNNIRYLNYFSSIQKSPLITLKKMKLNSIIISGAPAIDNDENSSNTHYITINKDSFYIPVVRIKSNGKFIYSSYNPKNSEKNKLTKIFYSSENSIKFDINDICFNDVCIEVMHKGQKSFRLLFTLQFNTFFINSNYSIKFSKEQIDSINQDIRYPKEFNVDLVFDSSKEEKLSPFDDYSIVWKTMLSEFIVKGLSNSKNSNKDNSKNNTDKKENKNENEKKNINNKEDDKLSKEIDKIIGKESENKNDEKEGENNKEDEVKKKEEDKKEENKDNEENENKEVKDDKDDDILNSMGNTNNTLNQVSDLLKKIEGQTGDNNEKEQDEEEDEDIENYLKNLENK